VTGVTGVGRLRRRERATGTEPHTARVVVRGRYEPDTIVAAAGRPLRITFRREDTLACSERVVFPDFGKSAMLPPHEDVTIDLVPERAGEYEFTCQLGLLRGLLIVTGPGAGAETEARL
jgi:plastocyanin domain-containing protein